MYVCLGVRRGLGRVLIKYSGNVRLQISIMLQKFRLVHIAHPNGFILSKVVLQMHGTSVASP